VQATLIFRLACPECGNILEMEKDKAGERYAICRVAKYSGFGKEYVVPTAELLSRLLTSHYEGEPE
jgi:hypothetical protein